MIIRKAIDKDKKQLMQLLTGFYIDHKQKTFSKKLQSFEEYKDKNNVIEATAIDYLSDKKYLVYVAEQNNELLGYIYGEVKHKLHKKLDKEGYIQDWFVKEGYRNKNIGRMLFEALVNNFKKLRCTHLATDTFVENKIAMAIYHQFGFEDKLLTMIKKL